MISQGNAQGLICESCERPVVCAGEDRVTEMVGRNCGCLVFRKVFLGFGVDFGLKKTQNFLQV